MIAAESPSTAAAAITVREAMRRWLKLQVIGKKPNTVRYLHESARIIEKHWPNLDAPADAATWQDCEKFVQGISYYAASRYNGVIHAIRKIVPAAAVLPRKKARYHDRYIPTPEELERLLTRIDTSVLGHSGLVVRFLIYTGLRINEANQLTWQDVKEDHFLVPGRITKNAKPRSIPFIEGIGPVLAALRKISTGDLILPQARCYKALKNACRLAGLPSLSHHSMRHLFATHCLMDGVDVPTVAKWMGHSDGGALLLKTYCHLFDGHSAVMAKRVKFDARPPLPERMISDSWGNLIPETVTAERRTF